MITEIDVSAAEVESGVLAPESREAAAAALRRDGVVVLNDVVAPAHLAALRERMLADLPQILARRDAPFNFNAGNVQQDPPPFPPYLFRDVLVNDMVAAVTSRVLGPGVQNSYYSGNTALPGGQQQPAHADVGQLWPNLVEATPAFGLVVNVPVVEMTPENGSTQLWPSSHLETTIHIGTGTIQVPDEWVGGWEAERAPVQPAVRCGSVLIRDIRLWHCGMPNRTTAPRPMIAMIHWIHWWHPDDPIRFPRGSESFFEHPVLKTNARFVEGEIDYLHHSEAYDYTPEEGASGGG